MCTLSVLALAIALPLARRGASAKVTNSQEGIMSLR
jgi:hypothetical protein